MNTRKLHQFIAVAEECSIRRAAEKLHITQPALTRVIRSLEEEVGQDLFVRKSDGVLITEAGSVFLVRARNIVLELEGAKSDLLKIGERAKQSISIGFSETQINSIIQPIIDDFSMKNRDINVGMIFAPKDQHVELLRNGGVSVYFGYLFEEQPDIVCEDVLSDPIWIAMHKNHPLARKKTIDISKLRDEIFIGATNRSREDLFASIFGFHRKMERCADDLATAMVLVEQGYGLFLVPSSARFLPFKNVKFRPFNMSNDLALNLQCVYLKDAKSRPLSCFLSCVRNFSASLQRCGAKSKLTFARGKYGIKKGA